MKGGVGHGRWGGEWTQCSCVSNMNNEHFNSWWVGEGGKIFIDMNMGEEREVPMKIQQVFFHLILSREEVPVKTLPLI